MSRLYSGTSFASFPSLCQRFLPLFTLCLSPFLTLLFFSCLFTLPVSQSLFLMFRLHSGTSFASFPSLHQHSLPLFTLFFLTSGYNLFLVLLTQFSPCRFHTLFPYVSSLFRYFICSFPSLYQHLLPYFSF